MFNKQEFLKRFFFLLSIGKFCFELRRVGSFAAYLNDQFPSVDEAHKVADPGASTEVSPTLCCYIAFQKKRKKSFYVRSRALDSRGWARYWLDRDGTKRDSFQANCLMAHCYETDNTSILAVINIFIKQQAQFFLADTKKPYILNQF